MQITLCPPAYATGYGYTKPELERIADDCKVVLQARQALANHFRPSSNRRSMKSL